MLKLNRSVLAGLAVTSLLYTASGVTADDDGGNQFKARLQGFNEVPAISSTGKGRVHRTDPRRRRRLGLLRSPSEAHLGSANRGVMVDFCCCAGTAVQGLRLSNA
jgi:hypothetical protein